MMEVMGVIAIMVNCALIGMSGQVHRLFPDLSTTGTIVLIVVLEVVNTVLVSETFTCHGINNKTILNL